MGEFLTGAFIEKGICGHEDKLDLIRAAASRKSASHSFMFYGPKNTGKLSCARLMTLSLNCLSPADGLACFKCENCLKILRGRFEYLTSLNYKFGEIPIDDIRNRIIAPCMLKVPDSVRSVYIINDARFFNSESANCFLKTLEEPTANVVFILITSSPDSVLPTIRSRCQMVRFDAAAPEAVKAYARSVNGRMDDECLDVMIEAAGSIGAAVAAVTAPNAAGDSDALMAYLAKLGGDFTAHDAGALIKRVYDARIFSEESLGDFCSENILQLEELFDKIEHACLAKQYLRFMIVYSLLYLSKKGSRRDYQAVCHELSHRIDLFFQFIESFVTDYIAGFKNTIPAPLIKELTEKAKRETARNKRDEFLKIVSLTLAALEKLYVKKALPAAETSGGSAQAALERLRGKIAVSFSRESLEKIIETMMGGHYRDVAANINVELYLERYLMSVIEK
ncbi:MAG: hypothetical protein A2008_07490 [Candidatus Wallbacteria bacterium GWC2_49_35]|uniref:DNA polymerase III subunit delta n=1 Tax=Candidatus Wallbacteria bacterium GWC2_49_35 TaxID=1817813 RepID=A0A1F7WQX1_9BACT|nr:MAG: hypothetical protein A2008_07490 [Candidatus Wallbacteria bacterium GWC2_49_35]HBC73572.1 hypothetical protein [Candidatus Wallbacteria bacterium]